MGRANIEILFGVYWVLEIGQNSELIRARPRARKTRAILSKVHLGIYL